MYVSHTQKTAGWMFVSNKEATTGMLCMQVSAVIYSWVTYGHKLLLYYKNFQSGVIAG